MVRKLKNQEKTKTLEKFLKKIEKNTQIAECIWDEKDECFGKIVQAHSIQNNRFLKKISKDGNIFEFSLGVSEDNSLMSSFKKIGRKSFSTFRGFCQKHDKELFQPIEDKDYSETQEQNFLFAFRAFAKEFHTKKQVSLTYKNLITEIENNPDINNFILKIFSLKLLNNEEISLKIFQEELKFFKKEIKEKTFNGLYTYKIILNKEYPIVSNSAFIPYLNVNFEDVFTEQEYEKIQTGEINPTIYLNIFPENNKTFILISCLERYKNILEKFFNAFGNKREIKDQLSTLILMYAQNTGFSPEYIENFFTLEEIEDINDLFIENLPNPLFSSKYSINLFKS